MVRFLTCLSVIACVGATLLALRPDPWAKADAQAARDATDLTTLANTPDQVSLSLSEEAALLKVVIFDVERRQLYPPPGAMTPVPFALSRDTIRTVTRHLDTMTSPTWRTLDPMADALLHCRTSPPICLIYDRAALETALALRPGALVSERSGPTPSLLLALMACLLAGTSVWRFRHSAPAETFQFVPKRHIAIRSGHEIPLTPRDVKLLALLQARGGDVVTKDELYDAAWGRDYMPNSRALDQHIITLRRKLDPDKSQPVLIETVRGVGYRLVL